MAEPAVQTFGKYQILERIATGGMAEIYKARLEGIGGFQRTFAIKRVLPHLSQNADYVAMLVDEAKVAGLLSHANIVQILDLGQVDGVWFIAMEYVNGRDLGAVLERCQERGLVLPVPHACFVAIELLKGLEYAHQRQVMRGGRPVPLHIIHRDVSPPNILLAFQGEVKLTDFGIARASLKVMETQAGVIKGRFDYMSPEQAMATRDLDQRSDLFSVGVVLYEMLAGAHPFRASNELDTLDAVRGGKYVPVSKRNPDVPFALETIVDRALRADRDERYPSATAFKEALDKFFHDSGFLFTQDTLGSYVQGLFPEAAPRRRVEPQVRDTVEQELPEDPPPTEEVPLIELMDDDGPTRVMPGMKPAAASAPAPVPPAPVPPAAAPPPLAPVPNPPRPRPALPDGEEATLIQPNLLAARRARATGEHEVEEDEAETVVEPDLGEALAPFPMPGPGAEVAPPPAPAPGVVVASSPRGAGGSTGGRSFSGPAPRTPGPAPRTPAPRAPVPAPAFTPRRASSLVPMLVLASAMLVAGILLGGAVGAGGALLASGAPGPSAAARSARLEVVAPPEAEVRVNGIVVAGGVAVAPEQPQRVEVRAGAHRWRGEVVVAAGETRILVVQPLAAAPE